MSESEYVADDNVAIIAAATESLVLEAADRLGVVCEISKKTVLSVARYFLRDINRIRDQQNGGISSIKFAGYWGFWIRKLKPLSNGFRVGENRSDHTKEVIEINELVALEISVAFILRISTFAKQVEEASDDTAGATLSNGHNIVVDPIRESCSQRSTGKCNGSDCVKQSAIDFMRFNNALNLRYIIYSMRHRTFGPHHFVTNLDHIVFGACKRRNGI